MDIQPATHGAGWIEVITGSMFSGKSEELIRRLRRAQIAQRKVQIFKPQIDNRYSDDHIISHSEMRIPSENLSSSRELLERGPRRHRSRRHRRGAVLRRRAAGGLQHAGRSGQARHRRRARPGLPRQAVRADAAAARDRGVHHQDARDLHGLRRARQPHAAAGRQQRARAGRRAGHLRGALPALLRSRRSGSNSASRARRARLRMRACRVHGVDLDIGPLSRLLRCSASASCAPTSVFVQFVRFCAHPLVGAADWPGRRPPFYRLLLALGAILSAPDRLQADGAEACTRSRCSARR